MQLLRDVDLITNLTGAAANRYIEGVTLPVDQYGKDSPVQASSIDLHIGAIYLPGTKETAGPATTKLDHVLKTGETAVVTTSETVRLPLDVSAFGFPPSSVSFKGLLMTNPGHVDPGYEGKLRFTVINMGKDSYALKDGDPIVTLMMFRLDDNVHTGWVARKGNSELPSQRAVNRLSRDFVDVERRAKSIAKKQGIQWSAGITIGVTLLGILLNSGYLLPHKDLEDLKKKQEALEKRMDIDQKLHEFDERIKELKRLVETQSQIQPATKGTGKTP